MGFLERIRPASSPDTTRARGQAAEDQALDHLLAAGLTLVARNYRTAGRGGGEFDVIVCERDGTVVFVEGRRRSGTGHGGAGGCIGAAKRRRIVFAARCYLMRLPAPPPCRFDVVLIEPQGLQWLRAAFDADGA